MIAAVALIAPPVRAQSCRICGARRRGDEPETAWIVDLTPTFTRRSQVRSRHDDDGTEHLEADEPAFARRHRSCEATSSFVVHATTGVLLDDDAAREVLRRHGRGILAGDRQTAVRTPWAHLTAEELAHLRRVVDDLLPPEPATGPNGRCAVCGRSRSATWTTVAGLAWSVDGRSAPMCSTCTATCWPAGGDLDRDLLTVRAIGLVADVRPSPSLRQHGAYGFRLASDYLSAEERATDAAEPWTYNVAALAAVRSAVRDAWPELILDPDERAAGMEALQRRHALAAEEAARREAASRVGATVW